jgi:hypothetical protein
MARIGLLILTLFVFGGCTCSGGVAVRTETPASGPVSDSGAPEARPKKDTPAKFHIPPGHLPKEGQCRIWIPGVPPGQQAPAGDCGEMASRVPAGAWLIHGVPKKAKEFEVSVHDDTRAEVVLEIRIYSTKDGSFLGLR